MLFGEQKPDVIFALSKPRSPKRLLKVVESFSNELYLVQADSFRGWSPEELSRLVPSKRGIVMTSPEEALLKALESSAARPVCVCGSFYLVGRVKAFLRKIGRLPFPS